MPAFALLDVDLYVAGHDFTGDTNQAQLNLEAAALDATTFGSGRWMENAYGLKTVAFNHSGFWQSALDDAVDPDSFGDLAIERVHTFTETGVETDPAWFFNAAKSNYQIGGEVGPLAPFSLASTATDKYGAIRGQLAKAKGAMNAIGALGSGLQLGAVAADQFLYASFHIFTAGTTATIQVQSATTGAFGAPTLRGTIGPLTTRGGTFMARVPGPITDQFYRFNVSAITGAFVAAGAIGIGK